MTSVGLCGIEARRQHYAQMSSRRCAYGNYPKIMTMECDMGSVECEVESVKRGVWCVECEVWSVEWRV